MAKTKNVITGSFVGGITLVMLVLNFSMIASFLKNYKTKVAA